MGRGILMLVTLLVTVEAILLGGWGVTLLAGGAAVRDLRMLTVVLFLAATAIVIAVIAVVATRPAWRSHDRARR